MNEHIKVGRLMAIAMPILSFSPTSASSVILWGGVDVNEWAALHRRIGGVQQLPDDRHGPAAAARQHPHHDVRGRAFSRAHVGGAGYGTGNPEQGDHRE